ncbi:neuroligin-4, X-linked-like [Bacillus rossius redtenbacheri]|uniref:neuroligin-4, X-linked-like n=1 Tax=Bacillus rossius redtenbacheri TaxID=93214 RepID=UPI002FDD6C30
MPRRGPATLVLHLAAACVAVVLVVAATASRVVHTRYGRLQGFALEPGRASQHQQHLRAVDAYLGIPYATPPVRSNRFSPTRTPAPWEGVRAADRPGPACPQRLPDVANETAALERMPRGRLEHLRRLLPLLRNQSEDCLYLNIYAPAQAGAADNPQRYPVIVFIHGESYEWNSGNPYDGSVLASYAHLVVVTINYRLGILGFLNANAAPRSKARVANYGLMDQIAALHWVQQNIALFGGDPGNVTLMGHGTGAACINFLISSPTVVPGLFHRAALLSGSALSPWALVEDPAGYAARLAREVNCSVPEDLARDHELVVDCLREVPLEQLLGADVRAPAHLSAFGPSVDGVVIRADLQREMLAHPGADLQGFAAGPAPPQGNAKRSGDAVLAASGAAGRYDLLFGVVTAEALWRFSAADVQSGFEGERRDRILRTYVRNAYSYHLSEIFFTVVNEYTDWERTVLHPVNTRDACVAALSDAQFVAPLVQTGDLLSRRGAAPDDARSFFYVFDYQTKDGDYPQRMGTVHGEELPYVFGAPLVDGFSHFPRNYTKSEVGLSESVMLYFGNFARTGNPNEYQKQEAVLPVSKERNRFRNIFWEEYDNVHQKYLEISMKPRMKNHFRSHQLSVWLRLIPELHRAGMEDTAPRHNLFRNHNDADLYDGVVRADPLSRAFPAAEAGPSSPAAPRGNYSDGPTAEPSAATTTCVPLLPRGQSPSTHQLQHGNDTLAGLEAAGYAAYSTALSVTIAIGCSLLVLNVLIFAGVYYQRDKTRLEVKTLQQQQQQQQAGKPRTTSQYVVDVDGDPSPAETGPAPGKKGSHQHPLASLLKAPPPSPSALQPQKCPNNVAPSPPNGSVAFHVPLPQPPPPPRGKSPAESQPLLPAGKGALKVPAAAMDEMRV